MRLYSQKDVDRSRAQGRAHRHPRLRQPGTRARAQPEGQRLRRGRRRAQGRRELEEGAERDGLRSPSRSRRSSGADLVAMLIPDMAQTALYAEHRAGAEERRDAAVRARLQHALQADQAAQGPGRGADRPEGPGRPGAPPVPARARRALPASRSRRMRPARRTPRPSPMRTASAARAAGCSRPPSPRRPRPICSASRRCCAAGRPSWSSRASRRWSRPATSRKSPTTSACTS